LTPNLTHIKSTINKRHHQKTMRKIGNQNKKFPPLSTKVLMTSFKTSKEKLLFKMQ
jgi:hypothetical protein